ncbi:hypothetical protein ACFFX0_07460 [Citricoccus parietis]|uniref:Uncharacterized protein n=1 Tax=Citricoccus parietis TaxID=592307 RepID=A0ABV5FWI1_9MICC
MEGRASGREDVMVPFCRSLRQGADIDSPLWITSRAGPTLVPR